jgi:hypothetical protein
MKAAYIVVEGKENADFLEKVLPSELLRDVQIMGMKGWSSAFSLASTIMSERSRPVLLVLESTSSDGGSVNERERTLKGLLLPAVASAAPYEVVVAVPGIGTLIGDGLDGDRVRRLQQEPVIQRVVSFLAGALSQVA